MSDNTIGPAYKKFDELRAEFRSTKKISAFFCGLVELLKTEGGNKIRGSIVTEYNHQASRVQSANEQKFAECAEKYGFPLRLER